MISFLPSFILYLHVNSPPPDTPKGQGGWQFPPVLSNLYVNLQVFSIDFHWLSCTDKQGHGAVVQPQFLVADNKLHYVTSFATVSAVMEPYCTWKDTWHTLHTTLAPSVLLPHQCRTFWPNWRDLFYNYRFPGQPRSWACAVCWRASSWSRQTIKSSKGVLFGNLHGCLSASLQQNNLQFHVRFIMHLPQWRSVPTGG